MEHGWLQLSLDSPKNEKENPPSMTKYLYRTCPKCKDYLGVVVRDPLGPKSEIPIDAYCCRCGFKLLWKVVLGNKGSERESESRKANWMQ